MNTFAIARPAGERLPESNVGKSAETAIQFEALLIASMLKSSREAGASWLGSGDDAPGESAISYAEEHLAQVLAAQGGLGIAATIAAELENHTVPYVTDSAGGSMAAAGNSGAER
jgi:Rod binding domain-containing protein